MQESLARYWAGMAVELCHDIDAASLEEHAEPVGETLRAMAADRRLLVIGGAQCGKSSLLAGLADCPLMAQVPFGTPYLRWRFRNTTGEAVNSRFVPLDSLAGLELIDTQDCTRPEVSEALRPLLPQADVVLAVLDARRVAESPAWELLALLPETANCVLAVTFTDKMSAEATLELKGSLRELCTRRLGRALPQYFISPAAEQAMEVFTERVQEAMDAPGGLRTDIRAVVEASLNLMGKQWTVLNRRDGLARRVSGFLAGIEREIDNFLSHQLASLPRQVQLYAEASSRALPRLLKRLRRVFGWLFSPVAVLRLELLGSGCERFYYRALRDEVLHLQEDSDRQFVLSCASHWKSVRPRMTATLDCEIGDFPADALALELGKLRNRLGLELYTPFTQLQLRHRFSELFTARAGWMRTCLAFCCLFLTCAGMLGLIGQDIPALAMVGMALLIWLGATAAHGVANRRICRQAGEQGAQLELAVKGMLGEAEERLVLSRVAAYRRLFAEPRRKVAQHEETLKPLQARHTEIYRQLHAPILHL